MFCIILGVLFIALSLWITIAENELDALFLAILGLVIVAIPILINVSNTNKVAILGQRYEYIDNSLANVNKLDNEFILSLHKQSKSYNEEVALLQDKEARWYFMIMIPKRVHELKLLDLSKVPGTATDNKNIDLNIKSDGLLEKLLE